MALPCTTGSSLCTRTSWELHDTAVKCTREDIGVECGSCARMLSTRNTRQVNVKPAVEELDRVAAVWSVALVLRRKPDHVPTSAPLLAVELYEYLLSQTKLQRRLLALRHRLVKTDAMSPLAMSVHGFDLASSAHACLPRQML